MKSKNDYSVDSLKRLKMSVKLSFRALAKSFELVSGHELFEEIAKRI